ncbi:MAG TPA: GDSL-type esterase/lipase family protein [Thermoanaerobaculia bacterium]|nr:GDSL-type esterase/lipase family protein [Thermoanaerobaculia bacterium]
MLGDSMVEAAQVDDRQTAAFLLEESLRQHFPGVEVRNLGISSAGLVHYHARWARWGRTMDADLVIVAVFGLNDFRNCSTELESFRAMRPYYVEQQGTIIATFRQPEAPSFSPLRLWAHRATRGLELVRLLRDVKAARQEEGDGGQPGFLDATIFVPDPPPPWPEAVARGVEYLRELIRETFAEGVPILVVYLPWRVEAIDSEWADFASRDDRLDRWRPRRLVEDVAGSESARFLSFTDVVAGLPAETKRDVWHVETDSHLSAVGNRLLAEALKAPVTEILEAPD